MTATFIANDRRYRVPSRPVLAICADGWDPQYVDDALERGLMPRLSETLGGGGSYALGRAQVPTFTNPNNVAIVTGVSAARNGIAGNHYRDEAGHEVQATDPSFLRATTIHAAAMQAGVSVLCVTAKDKLRRLLSSGGVPAFSAECAGEQSAPDGTPLTELAGAPNPGIYDWRLSPYTIDLAVALARAARREARLCVADRLRPALRGTGRGALRRVPPSRRCGDRSCARRRLRRRARRRPRNACEDRRRR